MSFAVFNNKHLNEYTRPVYVDVFMSIKSYKELFFFWVIVILKLKHRLSYNESRWFQADGCGVKAGQVRRI